MTDTNRLAALLAECPFLYTVNDYGAVGPGEESREAYAAPGGVAEWLVSRGVALASGTGTEGPTPTNDMLASVREDGERVRASRVAGGEGPDDEIQREIREGTPNTPERVARIRQADEVYARASAPSEVAALTVAIHERNVMAGELARASARIAELEGALRWARPYAEESVLRTAQKFPLTLRAAQARIEQIRAALGEPARG